MPIHPFLVDELGSQKCLRLAASVISDFGHENVLDLHTSLGAADFVDNVHPGEAGAIRISESIAYRLRSLSERGD